MNKFFSMMVALVATLFVTNAFAWDPPASPAPTSWISDTSNVLSADAHARLDAKLKVINQSSANEIAALIVPSLNGEDITNVADLTFKAWGVGKKNLDNGVLVVLAMKEHKSHITTGKGVEGDLPDLKCSDVLQAMRPYLRSGNVEGALGYAFDQSSTLIANHKAEAAAQAARGASAPATAPRASNSSCQVSAPGGGGGGVIWFLILGGGTALLIWYLASRANSRRLEEEAQEERNRLNADAARLRSERLNAEREANRRAEEVRLQSRPVVSAPLPVVEVPVERPAAPVHHYEEPQVSPVLPVVVAAAVSVAAEEEAERHREAEARRRRLQQEEDDNRRRREQAEADDRRRREESSSSYSSSSSWDSGSSSSGGGWDSGGSGGFGGGDSGGGGASGDW